MHERRPDLLAAREQAGLRGSRRRGHVPVQRSGAPGRDVTLSASARAWSAEAIAPACGRPLGSLFVATTTPFASVASRASSEPSETRLRTEAVPLHRPAIPCCSVLSAVHVVAIQLAGATPECVPWAARAVAAHVRKRSDTRMQISPRIAIA